MAIIKKSCKKKKPLNQKISKTEIFSKKKIIKTKKKSNVQKIFTL